MLSHWSIIMPLSLILWSISVFTSPGYAMDRERDEFFGYSATHSLQQDYSCIYEEAIEKSQLSSDQKFYYLPEALKQYEFAPKPRPSEGEENNQVRKKEVISEDYPLALTQEEMQTYYDRGLTYEEVATLAGSNTSKVSSLIIKKSSRPQNTKLTSDTIRIMYSLYYVYEYTYQKIAVRVKQPQIRVEYYLGNMPQDIKNYLQSFAYTSQPKQPLDIRRAIQASVYKTVIEGLSEPKM